MDFVQLYTTTNGRINRKTWWLGVIGFVVFAVIIGLFLAIIGGIFGFANSAFGLGLIELVMIGVLFVPYQALTLKRLHDRSRPENLFWIFIAPSILSPVLMILGLSGTMVEGRFWEESAQIYQPNLIGNLLNFASFGIGIWALVELGFLKGDEGDNAHGPNPSSVTPVS